MSKEMTSKEAFYILIQAWHGNKDTYDYPSFDDINEAFDTLKQALNRLEALEQEHANALQVIKILTDENKAQEMKKKVGWF